MAEYNLSDMWNGSVKISIFHLDEPLTKEVYNEIFDTESIPFNTAKSILETQDEPNADEIIGIGFLKKDIREEIANQIKEGSNYGEIQYGDISIDYDFTVKLRDRSDIGVTDTVSNIDDYYRKHIVDFLKDTAKSYCSGSYEEYIDFNLNDAKLKYNENSVSVEYNDSFKNIDGEIPFSVEHLSNSVFPTIVFEDTAEFTLDDEDKQALENFVMGNMLGRAIDRIALENDFER